jgi:hypothetical protein
LVVPSGEGERRGERRARLACLEVDRDEPRVRGDGEAQIDEALALPFLGAGSINLDAAIFAVLSIMPTV